MILDILLVVLPVFLVIGAGYTATRTGLFHSSAVDGLMVFTQSFAVPCLLFRGLVDLDFGAYFDPRLLFSFYLGAVVAFALGILGARRLFHRRPGEAVAIGFGALFSNSVLLGLPIMEHAYGRAALAPNFAIISIHAPFCYLLGTTAMEFARADGRGLAEPPRRREIHVPQRADDRPRAWLHRQPRAHPAARTGPRRRRHDGRAALPAALFGLGGVFTRYAIRASLAEAGMIAALSLLVHPGIAYALSHWAFHLPEGFVRSAVMTAAMAPGVNSYVFASLYSRGQAQAASAVLLATAASVLTISVWLAVLGGVQ